MRRENEIVLPIADRVLVAAHALRAVRNSQRESTAMKGKYPRGMTYTQWRRTPYRTKHAIVGVALNDLFGHWRSCPDHRCRRARRCRDYRCYWRRLSKLPHEEQMRLRTRAEPLAKLLSIGSGQGSERLWSF
jgi:hypothetical protein